MTDLPARSPFDGIEIPTAAGVAVTPIDPGPMSLVQPYRDTMRGALLMHRHGLPWPEAGRSVSRGDTGVLWFGFDQVLLVGELPAPELRKEAAITDQSDAWAALKLSGPQAEAVLARLVPLDLDASAFPVGAVCRTGIQHIAGCILRDGPREFTLLVPRSMTKTVVHELALAARRVDARVSAALAADESPAAVGTTGGDTE